MTKISNMDVPTSACKKSQASQMNPFHLGPLELNIPSVSFHTKPTHQVQSKVIDTWTPTQETRDKLVYSGLWVPVGYMCSAILMLLGNVLVPHWIHHTALMVWPIWAVSLLMHTGSQRGIWFWHGMCLYLCSPLLVVLRDISFVVTYTICFSALVSGSARKEQRGVWLVCVCTCWLVILAGAGLSLVWPDKAHTPLTASVFTSLVMAIICTRNYSQLKLEIYADGQT